MYRARVQTGNPGFDTPEFGYSRVRSFWGSVVLGTGNPGFNHSHSDNYELPNPKKTEHGNDRTWEARNPGSSESGKFELDAYLTMEFMVKRSFL